MCVRASVSMRVNDCAHSEQRARARENEFIQICCFGESPPDGAQRDAAAAAAPLEGHHEKSQGESRRVTQYFSFVRRMTLT